LAIADKTLWPTFYRQSGRKIYSNYLGRYESLALVRQEGTVMLDSYQRIDLSGPQRPLNSYGKDHIFKYEAWTVTGLTDEMGEWTPVLQEASPRSVYLVRNL
jgi:hypothetical protein